MPENILTELSAYSLIELIAVLLAVIYLLLATRNLRLCWVAAFISSALFVAVLWNAKLVMDAALNAYYVLMAVYGWFYWSAKDGANSAPQRSGGAGNTLHDAAQSHPDSLPIGRLSGRWHLAAIGAVIALSLASGVLLERFSQAAFPFLDSLTTWGSLLATWLLARRILETWLYWIVLDALAMWLYFHKDLHFTMALFGFYVLMSFYGYYYWRKECRTLREQRAYGESS